MLAVAELPAPDSPALLESCGRTARAILRRLSSYSAGRAALHLPARWRIKRVPMSDNVRNVIIIGSGCSGLTAAIYAARANLKPLVIDGHEPGGQLAITTLVENFPRLPRRHPGAGTDRQHARAGDALRRRVPHRPRRQCRPQPQGRDGSKKPLEIKVGSDTLQTRTLIIASGASARWLGLPNEQALIGHGVSSCATCDGFFFSGKEIAVIGGGDSAMEEALFLTRFAKKVTLIHRRGEFRASKIMLDRARKHEQIEFLTDTVVDDVLDVSKKEVTGLRLRNLKTGEQWDLPTSAMFLGIGHTPNAGVHRRPARPRRRRLPHPRRLRMFEGPGRLHQRRRGRPPLSPGHHRGRNRLHGRARSREVPGRDWGVKFAQTVHCKVRRSCCVIPATSLRHPLNSLCVPSEAARRTRPTFLRRDLEHHAAIVIVAGRVDIPAGSRRAVHRSIRAQHKAAVGVPAIASAGEVVQRGISPAAPRRAKLEHRTLPISAVFHRRAVEIPCTIPCEFCLGTV